jgi:diguanylate cyclase (GGDEF)-like protein
VQQRLAEIASKDGITGLLNPRTFHTHIEGTVARLRTRLAPTTLVLIDIDNFKHCNDTYGHQQGDELLQRVGDLILESIRKGDQGYRYGGDEFAILLHGADATIGSRVGERLRTVYIEGESFGTSMSVGVAQYQPGMDARDFVRAADKALYEAKGAGKNQIHVA